MMDTIKQWISTATEVLVSLLALAIVATLLVGGENAWVFKDVVGNIIGLINQFGEAGLAGLIALGVVLWLFQGRK